MDHLGMALMIDLKQFGCLLVIFCAISHPNGATLQFVLLSGKRMGLEIVNHLQLVFDIALEEIRGGKRNRIPSSLFLGLFPWSFYKSGRFVQCFHEHRTRRHFEPRVTRACGEDRWAGVATVVPLLPQAVMSTVNLAEVESKLADAAQNLAPQSPAHLARTGSPESAGEAMWII